MIKTFPTNLLTLESCDCGGKTTLYNAIHKESSFAWNIQDRSWLSMLVYAKLYGRSTADHAKGLWSELSNLNNRMIFLLPPWEVIHERFNSRGDEHQNEESLKRLYGLFEDHDWVTRLPSVLFVDNSATKPEETAAKVVEWLNKKETMSVKDIANEVRQFVENIPNTMTLHDHETSLQFSFIDDGTFQHVNHDICFDPQEGAYYQNIIERFHNKLQKEIMGDNDYKEVQGTKSRRFIYTDDSCISLYHMLNRNGCMNVNVTLRSSNVRTTLHKDIDFVYYMTHMTHLMFTKQFPNAKTIFNITINSAHVVR